MPYATTFSTAVTLILSVLVPDTLKVTVLALLLYEMSRFWTVRFELGEHVLKLVVERTWSARALAGRAPRRREKESSFERDLEIMMGNLGIVVACADQSSSADLDICLNCSTPC